VEQVTLDAHFEPRSLGTVTHTIISQAAATTSGSSAQSQLAHQQSPESFDIRVSPTLSDPDVTPSHPQRHQNLPLDPYPPTPSKRQLCAGLKALGPAGNKKSRLATDTHTFFEEQDGKRICKFCL
jgi:hypothetical protein